MKDLRITTAIAGALLAAGCGSQDNGWTQQDTAICVDREGKRAPDGSCPRQQFAGNGGYYGGGGVGSSAFLWYYLGRRSALPYYGERVGGGSFTPAAGRSYFAAPAASAMTRSAAVSRGGFGSSARSFGGEGGAGE